MARLFIGIPLPEQYQIKTLELIDVLKKRIRSTIRWTRGGNAHVTLLFLGDVDAKDIPRVKELLAGVRMECFQVRAGKCGGFPDLGRPQVLYSGITKGAKLCERLAAAVAEAMQPFGIKPSTKSFKGHITLGRVKNHVYEEWPSIFEGTNKAWPGVDVDRFVLWESRLSSEGPAYTPLAEFPLQPQP